MALNSWVWAVMVERQQRTQLPPAYGSGPGPEGGERGSSGDGPRDKRRAGAPRRGWRPALCFGQGTSKAPSPRVRGPSTGKDSASPAREPLGVQDQHALALEPQPAAVREVGERLVDGLAGSADVLGD